MHRPPYSDVHPVPTTAFLTEFSDYLKLQPVCALRRWLFLVISMDDSTDPDLRPLSELLETLGLQQHVTFATHISGHWFDLIITCSFNDITVISPHPSMFQSDNCFIECSLSISSTATTVKEVSFRKWKDIHLEAFKGDILASELKELPVTDLATTYDRTLRSILDKHAPVQRKILLVRPRVPGLV